MKYLIPRRPRWFRVLWIFNAVNFALFWIVAQILGGDAISGAIVEGQHFLGDDGVNTAVSADVYRYSLLHTRFTFILLPITFILWAPITFINYQMNKR